MYKALCLFLFINSVAFASNAMGKRWNHLYKLINEEKKTIKSLGRLSPKLQWRLLELNTELVKLVKEKENKTFLTQRKRGVKKSYYFRESRKLNQKIVKQGKALLKSWPSIPYAADIYYTLALNSRDYGHGKRTEFYLLKSLKRIRGNAELKHKVRTSLAEYYYNNKKYKKAIRFYSLIIKNEEDEWLTKHHYNLSWCYIKSTKYSKAIDHALISHGLSMREDKRYVSVESQVLDSIGLFYTLDNRTKEGVDFYLKNAKMPADYLLKMAAKTATDGKFKLANYIYEKALDFAIDKGQFSEQEKIYLSSFDFYRNFKRLDLFFKTSKSIEKLYTQKKLSKEGKEESIEKIKSLVGYLQIRFTRNSKSRITEHSPAKRKEILSYFDILMTIHPEQKIEYFYFQGETYFAVNMFNEAYIKYDNGLNVYLKNPKAKIEEQKGKKPFFHRSLNSKLACLEYGEFKKDIEKIRQLKTFGQYVTLLPKDEKSPVLNQKIFNIHLRDKNIAKAETALDYYIKTHKKDSEVQRQMYTKIFDYFINKKDANALALRIQKVSKGFLSYKKDFIKQSTKVLGQILFSNYEKKSDDVAIEGYHSLFENPLYPKEVKSNSALKLGILYNNLNKTDESVDWYIKGLNLAETKVVNSSKGKIKTLAIQYNHKLDFENSNKLTRYYLRTFCKKKNAKKDKNLNQMYILTTNNFLLSEEPVKARKFVRSNFKCPISNKTKDNSLKEISVYYSITNDFKGYISFHDSIYPKFKNDYISTLKNKHWYYYQNNSLRTANSIRRKLKKLKVKDFPYQLVKDYEKWKKIKVKFRKLTQKNKFNEAVFNKNLESNIKALEAYEKQANMILKQSDPEITPLVYAKLTKIYSSLIKEVRSVHPNGVPKEYVKGFKGAMKNLSYQMEKKIKKLTAKTYRLFERRKVASHSLYKISTDNEVINEVNYKHAANQYTISTDNIEKRK